MAADMIDYGSVCSGIEAATVAVHPLGWKASWFAEIEAFPSAVLAHHYPDVANLGDMTKIAREIMAGRIHAPSLLVGGTPCQAFSVAGMRAGLDDARGQLTIKFVELADAIDHVRAGRGQPESVVWWENVPGVLSDKGNAFGCFLGALVGESIALEPSGGKWSDAGCVYGPTRAVAWRVLDAQYFGLAQRRRRVFVVASARAGFDPASVLFESGSLRRDTAPSRTTGETTTHGIAPCLTGSGRGVERGGDTRGQDPVVACYRLVSFGEYENDGTSSTVQARDCKGATDLVAASIAHIDVCPTICAGGNATGGDRPIGMTADTAQSLLTSGTAVRRLTPRECERLQGFPDDYTLIPWRGKPAELCPDGPRYKGIGNSKATHVVRWIANRIDAQVRHLEHANDNKPAASNKQVG